MCTVLAHNNQTIVRDKTGQTLFQCNTLLPNGGPSSTEKGKTLLQGILNKREKIIYLIDVLMWNEELLIDNTNEFRLIYLITKLKEIPNISLFQNLENEIRLRYLSFMDCTRAAFDTLYFGISLQMQQPFFPQIFEGLLNYITSQNLMQILKIDNSTDLSNQFTQRRICSLFAQDNTGEFYLKNGIAFVFKEGIYSFGYSNTMVKWKDECVSPFYERLIQTPMVASLCIGKGNKLLTFDGYIIEKTDPAILSLAKNQTHLFTYQNVLLNEPFASLDGLRYVQTVQKTIWNSMSKIVFKILAAKRMLTYNILSDQIQKQEAGLIH